MKKFASSVFLVLVLLVFTIGNAAPAFAMDADTPPGDIVYTEYELDLWCMEHDETGGTVYLGDDITIEYSISGGYGGGFIVIDTGEFGIIYDGGCIALDQCEIIGEGVRTPVVTVTDAGPNWWMGNWNNDIAFRFITAYGREGEGGVAVRVMQDDGDSFHPGMNYDNGRIRSFGNGAVGLLLDVPMDIWCFNIEVSGENALAVSAPDGTNIFFSRLSAEGAGSMVVAGSGLTLDACTASPAPADAKMISRKISDVSGKRFYLPVQQYDFWIWPYSVYTFWLSGSDGSEMKQGFIVEWDQDAIDAIDTSVLGEYIIQGCFFPMFDGFGLCDDFPLELLIEVRDPEIPCIADVYFYEEYDENYENYLGMIASMELWKDFDGDAGDILYRSDDGGITWFDCMQTPDIGLSEWDASHILFHYTTLSQPVMFYLETSAGESNVVTLYEKDGVPYGDTGGNRNGENRQGGGELGGGDNGSGDDNGGNGTGGNGGNGNTGGGNGGNGGNGNTGGGGNGTGNSSGTNPGGTAGSNTGASGENNSGVVTIPPRYSGGAPIIPESDGNDLGGTNPDGGVAAGIEIDGGVVPLNSNTDGTGEDVVLLGNENAPQAASQSYALTEAPTRLLITIAVIALLSLGLFVLFRLVVNVKMKK